MIARVLSVLVMLLMPVIVPVAVLTSWVWGPLLMLWLDSRQFKQVSAKKGGAA